jgi:hypothetical protein
MKDQDDKPRPVKIGAKLPPGKMNGLDSVHAQLAREYGTAYVIMEVGHKNVITHPGGAMEPVAYIIRIEGLPGALGTDGANLLSAARTARADAEKVHAAEPSERLPFDLGRTGQANDGSIYPTDGMADAD